ncbi:hypothetical protein FACS1894104_3330 [Actinomycetota bacterium]|nr:hypothetical protein FACS1894104_3330 [Actinomycetota bacterium]
MTAKILLVLEPLLNAGGGSLVDDLQSGTAQLTSSFWGVVYMVLVAPVCEELVFRGAVLRKLEKYGANFAIITSSLLFGLYHVILFQAVFAFFIGVILAYTAGRFSIKWSILLHMLNNILAVMSYYFNGLGFYLTLVYLFALLTTFFIYFFSRELIAAQKIAGASVLPNIYATAYVSPWLIAYIILCVGSGTLLLGII